MCGVGHPIQDHVMPAVLPPSVQAGAITNDITAADKYEASRGHESTIDEEDDIPDVVSEDEEIAHMDIPLDDEFDF